MNSKCVNVCMYSSRILELASNRKLEDLTNKWWDSNELHVECPRLEDESDGISIKNIGGVFLVIAIGTALSFISFVCEYYYYKIRPQSNSQAYKLREGNMSRLESEITLDNVQIQRGREIGDVDVPRDNDESRSRDFETKFVDYRVKSNSISHDISNNKKGLNKRKTSSMYSPDTKDTSNGRLPHVNGHVKNGIMKSIFTYENAGYSDSRAELFPGLQSEEDLQNAFTEKL